LHSGRRWNAPHEQWADLDQLLGYTQALPSHWPNNLLHQLTLPGAAGGSGAGHCQNFLDVFKVHLDMLSRLAKEPA